jgi:hypothetical protein
MKLPNHLHQDLGIKIHIVLHLPFPTHPNGMTLQGTQGQIYCNFPSYIWIIRASLYQHCLSQQQKIFFYFFEDFTFWHKVCLLSPCLLPQILGMLLDYILKLEVYGLKYLLV